MTRDEAISELAGALIDEAADRSSELADEFEKEAYEAVRDRNHGLALEKFGMALSHRNIACRHPKSRSLLKDYVFEELATSCADDSPGTIGYDIRAAVAAILAEGNDEEDEEVQS